MTKIKLTIILLFTITLEAYSQNTANAGITSTAVSSGIGLGSVLAVVTSWERNKSVLWALVHGIFSWLYVIYFVITRKPSERKK